MEQYERWEKEYEEAQERKRQTIKFAMDFETSVYDGQENTEVWSSALIEIGNRDAVPVLHSSIDETYEYLINLEDKKYITGFYHNLKFDGMFWLDFLLRHGFVFHEKPSKKDPVREGEFNTLISALGQWYKIEFVKNGHRVELLDSLKLVPLTLEQAGKGFGTVHQKLEMEYTGERHAGYIPSEKEKEYIKNDVYVLKEVMEYMLENGHDKMTIGSCCMSEFKHGFGKTQWERLFPDLSKLPSIDPTKNADEWLREAYKGGWCYVNEKFKGVELTPETIKKLYPEIKVDKEKGYCGQTADENSLYPGVMLSDSGNRYPTGRPNWWKGDDLPDECFNKFFYYFIQVKCSFEIKPGFLPFIQIKNNFLYPSHTALKTSYPVIDGKEYKEVRTDDGNVYTNVVTLTLTKTDWELMLKHYNVKDLEIIGGCWFYTDIGLFDNYINKYKQMKIGATNKAERQIAKLYSNNLYGRFAQSSESSYKIPFYDKDLELVRFKTVEANDKKCGYIPVGAAVTSYGRLCTITAAQDNFERFCYADTDSIHCIGTDPLENIEIHPKKYGCWKLEHFWDSAIFTRQKTYIEHQTHADEKPICEENKDGSQSGPYYDIKCAGMNDTCKEKFNEELNEEEKKLTDFTTGLKIFGKLIPVTYPGGVVLQETYFTML